LQFRSSKIKSRDIFEDDIELSDSKIDINLDGVVVENPDALDKKCTLKEDVLYQEWGDTIDKHEAEITKIIARLYGITDILSSIQAGLVDAKIDQNAVILDSHVESYLNFIGNHALMSYISGIMVSDKDEQEVLVDLMSQHLIEDITKKRDVNSLVERFKAIKGIKTEKNPYGIVGRSGDKYET